MEDVGLPVAMHVHFMSDCLISDYVELAKCKPWAWMGWYRYSERSRDASPRYLDIGLAVLCATA